jgi:uncharacterized protein (TIRG00374 family)
VSATSADAGRSWRWWAGRAAFLGVGALSLYLLMPALVSLFGSWRELGDLDPAWIGVALGFECLSYVSLWEVQRIALRTPRWFAVGTAQLAGGAAGSLVPGGGATASAVSYRFLVRAGIEPAAVTAGLAAAFLATTAAVLALPVLAVPAIVGGAVAPGGLRTTAYVGVAGFALVVAGGAVALTWDRPLVLVARAVTWSLVRLHRRPADDQAQRLLAQRDAVRRAFGARWRVGVAAAVGKWGFDYLALVCCLRAVQSHPDPSLVLLAYAAGALLGMIPFTPGGLGFVEAGLTGLLALAGVGAQQAAVATLAYRLIGFWLPLPAGGVAALLHRRRYGGSTATPPAAVA